MSSTLGGQLPELTQPLEDSSSEISSTHRLPHAVLRIPVSVQVVIGTARLPLSKVAELKPGTTITLEEKLGTSARVLVNGREVARGELFVLDGEGDRLGLTITEIAEANAAGT
jgi:flagellar motor switch protein FliN/FliY